MGPLSRPRRDTSMLAGGIARRVMRLGQRVAGAHHADETGHETRRGYGSRDCLRRRPRQFPGRRRCPRAADVLSLSGFCMKRSRTPGASWPVRARQRQAQVFHEAVTGPQREAARRRNRSSSSAGRSAALGLLHQAADLFAQLFLGARCRHQAAAGARTSRGSPVVSRRARQRPAHGRQAQVQPARGARDVAFGQQDVESVSSRFRSGRDIGRPYAAASVMALYARIKCKWCVFRHGRRGLTLALPRAWTARCRSCVYRQRPGSRFSSLRTIMFPSSPNTASLSSTTQSAPPDPRPLPPPIVMLPWGLAALALSMLLAVAGHQQRQCRPAVAGAGVARRCAGAMDRAGVSAGDHVLRGRGGAPGMSGPAAPAAGRYCRVHAGVGRLRHGRHAVATGGGAGGAGIGAAVMMALTMAFVGDLLPKDGRSSAMGLLGAMSAVGTALGPTLGGLDRRAGLARHFPAEPAAGNDGDGPWRTVICRPTGRARHGQRRSMSPAARRCWRRC